MTHIHHTLLAAAAALLVGAPLAAQPTADPSGHWEGTLQAPSMEIPFAIDIVKNEQGQLAGTISLPGERIKGLPLQRVIVDGATISFQARADQPMSGTLSADATTISGDYSAEGATVPFNLTRRGDARIDPPLTSGPVADALAGTWNATIAVSGAEMHVVLTLGNRNDGRSVGQIVNLDQGGLRLPLAIAQDGASVTLTSTAVASTFTGALNAAGDLAGTFTQGSLSIPVTFHRAAPSGAR
jgi:hypothetical protein